MLTDELKKNIQDNYSNFLQKRQLQARYGQKLMIAEIARTLDGVETDEEGRRSSGPAPICVVEAGTGTGKTIAYLVSSIPLAQALNKQVVIATATVALQEQIMFKDLPDLQRNSGMDFSYALAKGRSRYLCLSRLDRVLQGNSSQQAMLDLYGLELPDQQQSAEDLLLYRRMLDALSEKRWQGDRDDWPEALENHQWQPVAVEHGQCSGNRCSNFNQCCFFKSRQDLQKTDCIVANHDLVLADLGLGGGVILPHPADTIYVFDEAHHLPVKSTSHFSSFLNIRSTGKWLEQLPTVFSRIENEAGRGGQFAQLLDKTVAAARSTRAALLQHAPLFEAYAGQATDSYGPGEARQFTFDGGLLDEALLRPCTELAAEFAELFMRSDKVLEEVRRCMEARGGELDSQQAENWYPLLGSIHSRCEAALQLWQRFGRRDADDRPPRARWLRFTRQGADTEISLSVSPVIAAPELRENLWDECFAAILTSATLSALGNFDFLSLRAGLHEASRFSRIASPFDFAQAGLLRIPRSGFDPADSRRHTSAVIDSLPHLLVQDNAALVLFSSRRQLQDVLQGLSPEWREQVLSQDDYPKQQLLRLHRERIDAGSKSIIFGLASMAEGIDLPGGYCTHVVIAKIPFAVPNDPVEATLAQWVKRRGGNPFAEVSVPEAAMRLIQASGRLLRSETDRGTITILDERLLTRPYGRKILDSLPPYRQEHFEPALA